MIVADCPAERSVMLVGIANGHHRARGSRRGSRGQLSETFDGVFWLYQTVADFMRGRS